MDLRVYYKNIREVEATITSELAVIVSRDTQDGGKAGLVSEVPRYSAAKLVVENRARLATPEEARAYFERLRGHSAASDGETKGSRPKSGKD